MTTTAHRGEIRVVATLAVGGAVLGFVLAVSRSGADGCAAAAHRVGGCVPGALVAAKPLVSAAVVGFLLGVLIAVAAVLAWREARSAVATLERRPAPRSRRSPAAGAQRGTFTPRTPH
jgi:hypothetical protein